MRSLQVIKQILHKPLSNVLYQSSPMYRFCQKKEESNDQQKAEQKETFDINKLVEDDSEGFRKQVIKHFLGIQEQLQQTNSNLKEKAFQIQNLDTIISNQNKKMKELRANLESQIEDVKLTRIRLEKEKEGLKIFAITGFAKEILEVQDNLERAIQTNKDKYQGDSLFEGVTMTHKILEKVLKKHGVVEIDCLNKKFDPNQAEALVQVDDPNKEPGTVAFIAQKGYQIADRTLRAARVGIVRERDN